jgi:hypothetical protein
MSTVARHCDVFDSAMTIVSGVAFEPSIGRLIDRPDRLFFGSQSSFIGAIRLENTARNSVKGKYWFPKPTLQLSFLY